jgi:hypothetical protein
LDQARRNIASLSAETGTSEPPVDVPASHQAQLATAKDLRKRAEALLLKNISPDDASEIRKRLHETAEAIRDGHDLTGLNEVLSDLLFYLED